MEHTVGERGLLVVVTLPIMGVSTSGEKQNSLAVLSGLLVGEDTLVLRPEGGVMILSLKEMRRDQGFSITFFDMQEPITVPPNMVSNLEERIERFAAALSLDRVKSFLSPHGQAERNPNAIAEVTEVAEGSSDLLPLAEPIFNTHFFAPRFSTEITSQRGGNRGPSAYIGRKHNFGDMRDEVP